MQIICSHENLDFDGLASMIGAYKLYPEAKMILPDKLSQPVKEFLALYKDTFDFSRANDLDLETHKINNVILVDTNQIHRSPMASHGVQLGADLTIYDHHPHTLPIDKGFRGIIEPLGATSTIIVEELLKKQVILNSVEATVLAMGIYQDTGSLRFLGTTARDVKAVAYLFTVGANLKVLNTFLDRPLNFEQQQLYNALLSNSQEKWINNTHVLFAVAEVPNYIGGMALIARKLGELYNAQVVILAVASRRQVDIVAQSRVEWVRIDELVTEFGGGGHAKAAAAKVKSVALESIVSKLEKLLPFYIGAPLTAKDLMNSPVKSLLPHQTIGEAARLLLRYGHSGMPVVNDGRLIGIISRRDVDKAMHHDLSHAPIKAYMSRNVKTVQTDTPISQIEELMIKNDIGRLPVCEKGLLVGIVTRTDLLQTIYEEYQGKFYTNFRERCPISGINTKQLLGERAHPNLMELLRHIGELGYRRKERVFLVGGAVRDLLMDSPNIDIDIVVEGVAPELAEELAQELGAKIRIHESFQTATVVIPDGCKLDFASTRTEFYAYPAALPTIESARLREDLYRRDFTVNAMAISLNVENFGSLIDYFCGYSDLTEGLIRVLHNLSFIEDPTRIIRALRFATKFGWRIEEETKGFLERALKEERLLKVSVNRLWGELKNILLEQEPVPILKALAAFRVEEQIFECITWDEKVFSTLELFSQTFLKFPVLGKIMPWRVYMAIILSPYPSNRRKEILEEFALSKQDKLIIEDVFTLQAEFPQATGEAKPLSRWHEILRNRSNETILAWAVLSRSVEMVDQVCWYLQKRPNLKPLLSGKDLLLLGAQPGPYIGTIIKQLELARLTGEIRSKEEELIFAQRLLRGG